MPYLTRHKTDTPLTQAKITRCLLGVYMLFRMGTVYVILGLNNKKTESTNYAHFDGVSCGQYYKLSGLMRTGPSQRTNEKYS